MIARVGEMEVKAEEVRATLDGLDPTERAALQRDPALLNQVVRSLLVQRLVLKEAQSKGHDKQPAVVAQLERARQTALSESYLQSVSRPAPEYPSDAELQAAYDANKGALLQPKQFRLAQIFVALPKGADKSTTDKATSTLEAVRKALKAPGADFAAVAKTESDQAESAQRGGEIGWLPEARIQPEIRGVVTGLAKGAVSEPVRLDDGWHILKLLETKEPFTPALEDVRPQLAQQMRAEKTKANTQEFVGKLLQANPVAINELALSKILPEAKR